MGILVNTGFDVGSSNPVDSRTVKNTTNERDELVNEGLVYENLKVYCKDTQTEYRWTGTEWEEVGTGGTVDLSGYAKTYTSLTELGLTADATIDDVIGALKDGETFTGDTANFTNYLTMFPNYCANDQYAEVKIERISNTRVILEWRQKEGKAYAIGGIDYQSKFNGWQITRFKKDGFADDSIVCIGDTVSADGVIQTLANLGFSNNILTWDTGVYRVSHVSGLTNLPSDITNTAPAFRLEHHDIKKWGANHNPNRDTWSQRHSVLYPEGGSVYHRFYESGATAGVFIKDTGWQKIQTSGDKVTLVTNTATLKLDVTKKNSGWYGAVKLTYLYDTSPTEIEISFRSATDDLRWAVINGQKYIKKITFTQDSSNTAHYTIGIEFSGTTYGCYQAEVIGGFADINSLTSEAFTGAKTAVYYSPWGKNNGVTLVSAPEDIGLTFPCTTVQLAQAMRNKFNVGVKCGAIGLFNCEGKASTITDAPSDYGLLHVETFGHDRMLIRFDGIGSSSYTGSWIGQIQGNNGTFSSITWERVDDTYSTTEQAIGTWIDGSTVYRKTFVYTFDSAFSADTTINIGNISGCKLVVKQEGVLQKSRYEFKPIPYFLSSSNYGQFTFLSSTGNLSYSGSALSEGAKIFITMEYTK